MLEFLPGRIKLIKLQNDVTTCFGKPHTEPEAMERRAPLCTNYRLRVCLCSSLTDSYSVGCFSEWLVHTEYMISKYTHAYMPTGIDRGECWAGTGAIGRMRFYERYHVGVSQPRRSLFMASRVTQAGSHGLCLSTVPREYAYTCSTF